ncbi:hypothetical protein Y032_0132g1727 [Ancylostoma ceylanicum]|uniref:Uncharacterized protein n=1 Tax=Ancylostoma ceylanicum TaxID=53326 RepID=A0A016T5S0_9BILA|nr:hypothetical protein Y032_0132g1727 [Ancylostoma ceylanicum]
MLKTTHESSAQRYPNDERTKMESQLAKRKKQCTRPPATSSSSALNTLIHRYSEALSSRSSHWSPVGKVNK